MPNKHHIQIYANHIQKYASHHFIQFNTEDCYYFGIISLKEETYHIFFLISVDEMMTSIFRKRLQFKTNKLSEISFAFGIEIKAVTTCSTHKIDQQGQMVKILKYDNPDHKIKLKIRQFQVMDKSTGQINNIGYKWYIGS